jgi:glucose/arabinose dehydrogenase
VPSLRSPGSPTPSVSGAPSTPGRSSGARKTDPLVVATNLTAPVGLTVLPDNTALVGERTTGRIVRVQPRPGQPVRTVRTLHGLDTAGDGGLLDLAVSPTYTEDGLIYAYITTSTDNRVVDFTLTGPVTPVVTGIPKGRTDNTGRIEFGGDGNLYVGTGDAGHASAAGDPHSLAGKVLRVSDIGDPAAGNPVRSSPVFTSGHRVVDGLCSAPRSPTVLEVEAGASGRADHVNALAAGANYGWPRGGAATEAPVASLPAAYRSPGGCAVLGGRLWVTSLDGRALVSAPLRGVANAVTVGSFAPTLANRYGRLKTVVAADDGALWLTTSNRDGHGQPVPADERVIRYLPASDGGGRSPV